MAEKEADGYVNQATASLETQNQQTSTKVEDAKKAAREKFGFDETSYEQKVWSKIKAMPQKDIIELLTEVIVARDKLEVTRANIQTQIDRSKVPLGAAAIIGNGSVVQPTKEQSGFANMFGRKSVIKAYESLTNGKQ